MFDSKRRKKKSPFGPPVLCRTFSFDPPFTFCYSLPPTSPNTYTDRHAGVQQTRRIPRQRALSAFTTELKAG